MQHLLLCKLKAVITTLIHNPCLYAHALLHVDAVDAERDKCLLSLCECMINVLGPPLSGIYNVEWDKECTTMDVQGL